MCIRDSYYDEDLQDVCDYLVSGQDCTGSNSPIDITYLKLTFPDSEQECNEISVRDDHLTIIEYPTATITEYTRQ